MKGTFKGARSGRFPSRVAPTHWEWILYCISRCLCKCPLELVPSSKKCRRVSLIHFQHQNLSSCDLPMFTYFRLQGVLVLHIPIITTPKKDTTSRKDSGLCNEIMCFGRCIGCAVEQFQFWYRNGIKCPFRLVFSWFGCLFLHPLVWLNNYKFGQFLQNLAAEKV